MANYDNLKAAIQQVIYENGNQEITGDVMQSTLLAMVNSLGAGYQCMGVATPETNPGTPDQRVFYFAYTAGTYTNFGGMVVNEGEVCLLTYDTTWAKQIAINGSGFATKEELSQLSLEVDELDAQLNGLPELTFQKSDYVLTPGVIVSGTFRSDGAFGTKNSIVLIPMSGNVGRTIQLTTIPGHYSNTIAFFTTDNLVSGEAPPYCAGTSAIKTSGQYIVPNGCACMYVYAEREGVDSFPSIVMLAVEGLGPDDIGAVAVAQGVANAGKVMVVGNDGNVAPATLDPGEVTGAVQKVESKTVYLATDTASLVTLGTGWSGTIADGFTHTSGTDALVLNTTTSGKTYLITIISDSRQENAYSVSIGDGVLLDPYNGATTQRIAIVSDGGNVKITPSTSYAGTISVKVQECVEEADAAETVVLTVNNVDAGNMVDAVSAFWNVAIGPNQSTLGKAVSASRNIAIGINSLPNLETGTRNIGIGTFAMSQLKNGLGNIAIGADANFLRQGGNDNIAIGRAALGGNKSESTNNGIFIGVVAGNQAIGDDNIAIGPSAGYKAAGGCVYVGSNAGFSLTGAKNVAIGKNAGYQTGTITGNWNTMVGPTTSIANGVSKAVAIGYRSRAEKTSQNVIGSSDSVETKVFGDLVVHGTDGIDRRIVFNNDYTVTWEAVE